ncbi:hypothetical protein GCM10023196_034620 [Actinoallomurus vinaceus]|uniref:DUF4351 domain-containing protein n=1 Tax=Actinoallomurus vinaceus TaxID=1080074 RepID=A0ABP8U8K1_9ACTN
MPTDHWPVYSPFAKEHFNRGKAEGLAEARAEGRARGRARAILIVLASRGFEVPEDVRARVGECTDLEQLDVWLRRVAVATSIDDVFLNG